MNEQEAVSKGAVLPVTYDKEYFTKEYENIISRLKCINAEVYEYLVNHPEHAEMANLAHGLSVLIADMEKQIRERKGAE